MQRLRTAKLLQLQATAPSLAVVSSSSAVALAAASTEDQVKRAQNALISMEVEHGVGPFERAAWQPGHELYDRALGRLRDRESHRSVGMRFLPLDVQHSCVLPA